MNKKKKKIDTQYYKCWQINKMKKKKKHITVIIMKVYKNFTKSSSIKEEETKKTWTTKNSRFGCKMIKFVRLDDFFIILSSNFHKNKMAMTGSEVSPDEIIMETSWSILKRAIWQELKTN